jgi:chemotaxis protein MotB
VSSACSPARSRHWPKKAADVSYEENVPLARNRQRRSSIDIWPGFVDALAQLLMVIIFILLVFTAGQFFLSDALSGRDKALKELQQQVSELSNLLSLEKATSETLRANAASLSSQLKATLAQRDALTAQIADLTAKAKTAEQALAGEQQTSAVARAQVEQLTEAVAALRQQLAQIAAALDVSEAKVKDQQTQIAE